MKKGKVYLVGAGPGDIGLVTLKAVSLIKTADVIIYDHLANPELLSFARKDTERIFGGKYPSKHLLFQEEINRLLVTKASQGKLVVRLKGGDPFLFGRGAEEAQALVKSRIPFEIVPGVSSALAVPAYAGIPVTFRNVSTRLNIVTGHKAAKSKAMNWENLIDSQSTLVILMGLANLDMIIGQCGSSRLVRSMPVAVISQGTLPQQKVVVGTVATIVQRVKKQMVIPPAIIVIGNVVKLRSKLAWFEPDISEPVNKKKR